MFRLVFCFGNGVLLDYLEAVLVICKIFENILKENEKSCFYQCFASEMVPQALFFRKVYA